MAPDQQIQLVELQEGASYIRAKCHTNPSFVRAAPLARLGVAPQQLTHESIIRGLPATASCHGQEMHASILCHARGHRAACKLTGRSGPCKYSSPTMGKGQCC